MNSQEVLYELSKKKMWPFSWNLLEIICVRQKLFFFKKRGLELNELRILYDAFIKYVSSGNQKGCQK